MGWFSKKSIIPTNLWTKCKGCEEAIYNKDLEKADFVCPKCDYHFRIGPDARLKMILDEGSYREFDHCLECLDPLEFKTEKDSYEEKIKKAVSKTDRKEAIRTGFGRIDEHPIAIGCFDFDWMGGSMGSVVGEKITRIADRAIEANVPLMLISASGGARMQEGILSLMQMIKTGQAIARLSAARLPYISFLTHPTTGGVTASFAMLGDVIMAEPKALIGFAGPRVIQQTIKQELPDGFQTSEFLLETGSIDLVVHRKKVKQTLANLLSFFDIEANEKFETIAE